MAIWAQDNKPMPKNGVMSVEDSKKELEAMGTEGKWIKKPVKSWHIKYDSPNPKKFTFSKGNYAEIYRGNTFMRFAPFVVKTDIESDQSWMQFSVDDYFGKNPSLMPWDLAQIKILWAPFDKSAQFAETMGSGGFKVKIEESSKAQLPLYINLTEDERAKILKNNRMVGQALLLKATLDKYEKPKTNFTFWMVIAIIALLVVIFYFAWQGGYLDGVFKFFGNIGKGFALPSQGQAPS